MPEVERDPFAPSGTFPARLAARIGCTEGQLSTLLLGALLLWVVSANGLPSVAWNAPQPARAASDVATDALPRDGLPAPAASEEVAAGPLDLPAGEPSAPLAHTDPFPALTSAPAPSPTPGREPVRPPADGAPTPSTPARPTAVVSGGYASAEAGTPLATIGVPEGSVAVARRAGQPSKVTYLRLSGTSTPLLLDVDPDAANVLDAQAVLWLCPVLDEHWEVESGDTALDDAPAYDCARPLVGVRSTAGHRWTFEVADLGLAGDVGVALVPAADATTPEFQVVFRLPAQDGTATEEEP